MRYATLPVMLLAAACTAAPVNLADAAAKHDWGNEPGAKLGSAFQQDVKRALGKRTRTDALSQIQSAGYECTFGEAHDDYPEPAAVCTRSFATRACQMDWEIMLTSDPKRPNSIEDIGGDFRRDCVGVDRDFPEPIRSSIDDQLAPANLPN